MRDIRIATRSRSVRSVSESKAPEEWPFLWNLSQRESQRFSSGGGERGSLHPLQMGRGYAACSRKAVFVLGLMTSLSDYLWGVS
jgi:hypothetical protein